MQEDNILEIRNLKAHFFTKKGVIPAVDGVDIDIKKGKIVGIVGESGCGKSMTAMSIMGLLKHPGKVVEGSIYLDGRDLTRLNKREMSKIRGNDISMIFQEPMTSLNPVIKIGNQIREAIMLHSLIGKKEAKQLTIDILKQVGIPEPQKRYDAYPHQLSGGLRQRVMIGMAIATKPKLLIADEPTTALDVTIQAQILRLMRKLCDETGTSIMIITHNMGVVAQICDYVYVMYAGRVMEEGSTKEIFENTKHPYTKGLLKSMPRTDKNPERLYTIYGNVPNLLCLPEGCAFSNRCDEAVEECFLKEPELVCADGKDDNHKFRCFKNKEPYQ